MNRATLIAAAFLFGFILGAAPCSSTPAARSDAPLPLPKPLVFPPETGDVLILPLRVIDGDTLQAAVLVPITIRLFGIQAPEIHTADPKEKAAGLAAKAYLESIVPAVPVRAVFKGREKYGRTLGDVRTPMGQSLSQMMIDKNHARAWDGKGKREIE